MKQVDRENPFVVLQHQIDRSMDLVLVNLEPRGLVSSNLNLTLARVC